MHRARRLLALFAIAWPAARGPVADAADLPALTGEVNAVVGLRRSEIVAVDIAEAADGTVIVQVPVARVTLTLDLRRHSVRSDKYQVLVQGQDGSLAPVEPQPLRTLRGVVRGMTGSSVAGSLLKDGLYATIRMGDARYWLEPIGSRVEGAGQGAHVLYRDEDVVASGWSCEVREAGGFSSSPDDPPQQPAGAPGGSCDSGMYVAELACDADYEYFLDYGSVEAVEDRINAIVNAVNLQYQSEVGIAHQITAIVVRTAEPDPYEPGSQNLLLQAFQQEWTTNLAYIPRDVAHLFTGKREGAGIAWTIGAVCEFLEHYCLSHSDCCGGFACSTDITSHELGHLWGAPHCGCFDPPYTMNPVLTCSNRHHPAFTIPVILAYRDTLACLDCGPEPCPADVNEDGAVGLVDMIILLGNWGVNPGHPADIDGDGTVGIVDFLQLLLGWGPCPF